MHCKTFRTFLVLIALVLVPCAVAYAQGVTTASMTGVVKDSQSAIIPGATVVATHVPSGTTYEAVTQGDGRFSIQGMRVGGPYKVTVTLAGFGEEVKNDITLSLGTAHDLDFVLKPAGVTESVTVVGQAADAVFSSSHTGAATAVLRQDIASLPTISGRVNDITRLSPQAGGSGTFAGQDNRMNNMTVDGSYFNNSFGLAGQPGERTGVAPISLEAIEQVQVSVAPFDVRQGNFVGAGVNTVTRSGSNSFSASTYYRYRNESFVGKEAAGGAFSTGTFDTTTFGEWAGGPIVKNKLFFFESFESQKDNRPLNTYLANPGGATATGNMTRVLASDLDTLSGFLQSKFGYETGPYQGISKLTPAKPFLMKFDYNLNGRNKVTFRYNVLNSETPVNLSSSTSLGNGRQTFSNNFLNFANSNYSILENIRSGIGEWNSMITNTLSNNLIMGYTKQDESRGDVGKLFPFVDILDGSGTTYTSFGSEPFTPNNELRYNTFQLQDNFTKYARNHSITFGGAFEKYHSENVYFPGKQSAYVYNSLADFYADANDFLANPNRTASPVTLNMFQLRYMNLPGLDKPVQPLDVKYFSAYAQDQWRPRTNLTLTGGIRVDVASFGATGFDNPNVDALTFRDAAGNAVQYNSGGLPKRSPLWSPRVGFNWDVTGDQRTQIRGGTGVFTGKPAYVWISNQIGNTGMLTGLIQQKSTKAYPFNPDSFAYKPASVTGAPATSVDLAVTDPNFKFPQTWRTNIALDRKLPFGLIGTVEMIYNRDVNGMAYINANLPAANSAYSGIDTRPRWVATGSIPACASAGNANGCVTRINNAPGNQIVQAIVLGNQDLGHQWTFSTSLSKPLSHGVSVKGAYSYGESWTIVDPGSVAAGSWNSNAIVSDPNNPALAYSPNSPGHRVFATVNYTKQWFKFGSTTVSAYFSTNNGGNTSYVFSGDANGDTGASNDLIYIPRNTAEMNFVAYTSGKVNGITKTFSAQEQADAFDAYIEQDKYLRAHRGEYAQRGAVFYPWVSRMDVSIMQDVFGSIKGARQAGQIRLDITNFGNLINKNWGAGNSVVQNRILTNPKADASGALSYNLAYVSTATGPALVSKSFQKSAGISDVYVMMLSFRYSFR